MVGGLGEPAEVTVEARRARRGDRCVDGGVELSELAVTPEQVARVVALVGEGTLNDKLARQVFDADLAHTVLAVPIAQERATKHLDTVCTLVDVDKVVVNPNVADSLVAFTVRPSGAVPPRVAGS